MFMQHLKHLKCVRNLKPTTKKIFMKKIPLLLLIAFTLCCSVNAQKAAKALYIELGGPGLASVNYDMRLQKKEDGLGFRVGVGGYSLDYGYGDKQSVLFLPVGVNYLLGKDKKHYFEIGAGFTYVSEKSSSNYYSSGDFRSSFGNLTFGYRVAPEKGGFFFKAEITPVFGKGFFIPYWAGVGFGYKF